MTNNSSGLTGEQPLFPAWLSLKALASTPYKNSAYALSEVVDNSFGAGAKNIHVAILCASDEKTPDTIAILDDGKGMDAGGLRRAIQYGNGEQVDTPDQEISGLGRFGVGLLSATFNQCHSLNIWSWQNGIDDLDNGGSALNVGLDVNSVRENKDNRLPYPEEKPLPDFFRKAFADFEGIHNNPPSGTLVIWQNFHKLTWKKADKLREHLAFECGRIYRNFINTGNFTSDLKIVLSAWSLDCQKKLIEPEEVRAVDPMFLTKWDHEDLECFDKSMFVPYDEGVREDDCADEAGNIRPKEFKVYDSDENFVGKYWIQASHRRNPDVVEKSKELGYPDPGNALFGKLAHKLRGVSILREGRELILDIRWLPPDQTTSRWVSVSVDFEAKLDKLFGVDSSKQNAPYLAALASVGSDEDIEDNAENEVVSRCAKEIRRLIKKMHSRVKEERRHARQTHADESRVSVSVSDARLRQLGEFSVVRAERHSTPSDLINPADNPVDLKKGYEGTFCDGENGLDVPAETVRPPVVIREGLKVEFVWEPGNGAAFFRVQDIGGIIRVILNQDHPLFERLNDLCTDKSEEETGEKLSLEDRLSNALENLDNAMWVIQRLLYCFARAECEAHGNEKDEFEQVRMRWGRVTKLVLKEDD